MIDQATIDRILDAAQIVDVVSDYVTLRRRGVNYVGLCPFHDDKNPSFYVSPSKGLCKCFSCGKGGNVVHFIMEHEQLNYPEALKLLAKKYGIEVKERELSHEEKLAQSERESLMAVNQFARDYFIQMLRQHEQGRTVGLAYLRSRGFRDDIIERFQLGYSLDSRDALAKEALRKGYKKDYLIKTGLCYETDDHRLLDRFAGRVIFPFLTLSGRVVAFGGRVLAAATKGIKAKYVNSPESEIYHKSNELYGLYQAKQAIVKHDRCYLVEGYTDVISMVQAGVENVVASSGTALTKGQIRLIHRFTNNITVVYDGDTAGIKASLRGIDILLEDGMNIKVCPLPDGEDPDSMARRLPSAELRDYLSGHETDFIRFKTSLLLEEAGRDPVKRAQLISSVVDSIAVMPEAIVRDVYIKECAQLLHVEERLLVGEVAKRRQRAWEERRERREREARAQQARSATASTNSPKQVNEPAPPQVDSGTSAARTDIVVPISGEHGAAVPPQPELGEASQGPMPDFPLPDVPPTPPVEETSVNPNAGSGTTLSPGLLSASGDRLAPYERAILQMVVRYGEQIFCQVELAEGDEAGEGEFMTVIDYVVADLQADNIRFRTAVYQRMLEEAEAHVHTPGFQAARFFRNHSDPELSLLGADLLEDRYELSAYHSKYQKVVTDEERLFELVPTLLVSYKYAVVGEKLRQIEALLQDPVVAHDNERCAELMANYTHLREMQSDMAHQLGDRVVMRV